MDIENLKYVVGQASENKPAIIRFFDSVNEYSTKNFNDEFLWLQNCVKPSKIIVLINSEGGSILYGMSTFSIINSCPIEVDCVIEGLAASMGSIIWAAGDNLYMHDYSLLMIHNPFHYDKDSEDESIKNMIKAFRGQLSTIYQKRFGLSKDEVEKIMDGEGQADGTYFDAKSAVKAGIISKDNVIKTTKQVRDKVKNSLEGVSDAVSMRESLSSISAEIDFNKLLEAVSAISIQDKEIQNTNKKTQAMEKDILSFGAVAAQLGFPAETEVASVSARITELLKTEASYKEALEKVTQFEAMKAELDNLKIQFAGKKAEVENAQAELESVKASLKTYQDAEKAARESEIEATVQAAIEAGKIDESSKDNWVAMARTNFEMVKATLDSIQAREKISEQIANDPANTQAAADAMKTAEQKMAEQVEKVVGKVELKKFN